MSVKIINYDLELGYIEFSQNLATQAATVPCEWKAQLVKETMNQAQQGDFVVSNLGGSGEEYILSGDKLAKRYKEVGNGIYQATGECRGVEYSGPETSFEASWGQAMVLKPGDMIVTPLPQKGEVYRIARQEFESTYRPIEK